MKQVSVPVLGVIGVLGDGGKQLLALELCGGESFEAWKGCLDDLAARGLRTPVLCIIDGNAALCANDRETPTSPAITVEGGERCLDHGEREEVECPAATGPGRPGQKA